MGTAFDQYHTKKSIEQYTDALMVKENILKRIDDVLFGNKVFDDDQALIKYILDPNCLDNITKSKGGALPYVKQIFQVLPTAIISLSSSLVGIMLTKEFLQKSIWDQGVFAYSAAIFSEIPGFVVGAISNYDIFGRIFDLLSCSLNNDQSNLVGKMYPVSSNILIPIVILALSLTAPTAAAYITYNTLGSEDITSSIQWIATASMIAARLIFSNFTLNKLSKSSLQLIYEKIYSSDDGLCKKGRLIDFKSIVSNTNLIFFQNPNDVNTAINSTVSRKEEVPLVPAKNTGRSCSIF